MAIKINGLARIKDTETAIQILLDAFDSHPMLLHAFPSSERRSLAMEAVLRLYVPYFMKFGRAYALDGNCREAVIIIHSKIKKITKMRLFIAGCPSKGYNDAISKLTIDEKQRVEAILKEASDLEKGMQFPKEYIYIPFLGVKKEFQSQGRGKMIMEKTAAYNEGRKIPIMLTASGTRYVDFYRNVGFKAVGITSSKEFQFMNTYLMKA